MTNGLPAPTLDAYIPIDRRHALAGGAALAPRSSGSVLETDVSGFTSLTALLARDLGRRRGAEELTRRLNVVFDALVSDVHEHGGAVVNFSGDSITCSFEGDSGLYATAAALAMQRWINENGASTRLRRRAARLEGGGGDGKRLAVRRGRCLDAVDRRYRRRCPRHPRGDGARCKARGGSARSLDGQGARRRGFFARAAHDRGRGRTRRSGRGACCSARTSTVAATAAASGGRVAAVADPRGLRPSRCAARRLPRRAPPGGRALPPFLGNRLRDRRRRRSARPVHSRCAQRPRQVRGLADPAHDRGQGQISLCGVRRAGRP